MIHLQSSRHIMPKKVFFFSKQKLKRWISSYHNLTFRLPLWVLNRTIELPNVYSCSIILTRRRLKEKLRSKPWIENAHFEKCRVCRSASCAGLNQFRRSQSLHSSQAYLCTPSDNWGLTRRNSSESNSFNQSSKSAPLSSLLWSLSNVFDGDKCFLFTKTTDPKRRIISSSKIEILRSLQ